MIYAASDLHGCPPEQFQQLLRSAGFTENDFLYVLGDVIDRGTYGAELLLWLSGQANTQLILGNHEAMLLSCGFLFEEVTEESVDALDEGRIKLLNNWLWNGGEPTLKGLQRLKRQDPELLEGVLDYLRDAPLYDCVEAGGRQFILVHAGLDNFAVDKPLDAYLPDELLWARPSLDTQYYADATVIFGHTPTVLFGAQYRGKAVKTDSWVCIDTGVADGNSPMLLRLDDMKEFYGL